jgi:hypothetical protein
MYTDHTIEKHVQHLSSIALLVALDLDREFEELCVRLDEAGKDTKEAELRQLQLIEAWFDTDSDRPWERRLKSSSLRTAIRSAEFRQSCTRTLEHYRRIPFHSVYVYHKKDAPKGQSASFLGQFYGLLDEITSSTSDIYFRKSELVLASVNDDRGARYPSLVDVANARMTRYRARDIARGETRFLIWDRSFCPLALPLGRYRPEVQIASVATVVSLLDAGVDLEDAILEATLNPYATGNLDVVDLSVHVGQVTLRQWLTELEHRHLEYPERGYNEIGRVLRGLHSPSIHRRLYSSSRIRVAAAIAAGSLALANQAEIVAQMPETWETIVDWMSRH